MLNSSCSSSELRRKSRTFSNQPSTYPGTKTKSGITAKACALPNKSETVKFMCTSGQNSFARRFPELLAEVPMYYGIAPVAYVKRMSLSDLTARQARHHHASLLGCFREDWGCRDTLRSEHSWVAGWLLNN